MDRRKFLREFGVAGAAGLLFYACGSSPAAVPQGAPPLPEPPPPSPDPLLSPNEDRAYWLHVLQHLAFPILSHLALRQLHQTMPIETLPGQETERRRYAHLEAFARLLSGIAPWLENELAAGEEENLRAQYADLARECLDAATDPNSADFMNFNDGLQPLVDASYLALAILRAPGQLWDPLDAGVKQNILAALDSTRIIPPHPNNWLLFSALIEAFFYWAGEAWNAGPIDTALANHEAWYKGDGTYGDGEFFHWDYYNSFVIHPYLIEILRIVGDENPEWTAMRNRELNRARRYAEVQERLISPEGSFPCIGRSMTYRFGAFHALAQSALRRDLPEGISPAQVRSALTAVFRRVMNVPGNFDSQGWLTIGFAGHQPAIVEDYGSNASAYLCASALLPLGLAVEDEFWSAPAADWTAKKAWSGQEPGRDHAED
ncbi:MAG TPA: DUF2264 domain-containing protein [bacterium]|nr:DUF2264 domain-containing protein [bacterium]